jgi:hypothetical protein
VIVECRVPDISGPGHVQGRQCRQRSTTGMSVCHHHGGASPRAKQRRDRDKLAAQCWDELEKLAPVMPADAGTVSERLAIKLVRG